MAETLADVLPAPSPELVRVILGHLADAEDVAA